MTRSTAGKTLKSLERSRLADQKKPKLPPWARGPGRPHSVYYLSRGNYDSAIVEGAFAAGIEQEKRGRRLYARCQMPARATHAWLRNEFYRLLVEHCEEAGAVVPPGRMWSESDPTFPVSGPTTQGPAGPVYPDGSFEVSWGPDLRCGFLVEAETRSRPAEVLDKIERYARVWNSWSTNTPQTLDGREAPVRILNYQGFKPVVFVLPKARTAAGLRQQVRAIAAEEAARVPLERKVLKNYLLLDGAWRKVCADFGIEFGFRVGWFFLFAGLDELKARGAFSSVYKPVVPSPQMDGGSAEEVDLRETADEVASAHEVDALLSQHDARRGR